MHYFKDTSGVIFRDSDLFYKKMLQSTISFVPHVMWPSTASFDEKLHGALDNILHHVPRIAQITHFLNLMWAFLDC